MINFLTVPFKIFYLFLNYTVGGISQDYYYSRRGHYFADLQMFNFAIRDFKIALEGSNDPNIEAALGWCYTQINELEKSLEYYRKAYLKSKDPEIVLGLAYAEYYNGNIEASKDLIERLSLTHKSDATTLAGIIKFHEETEKWENRVINQIESEKKK